MVLFLQKIESKTVEGKGANLAVIIEFSSKEVEIEAYNRSDYQELSKLSWLNSKNTNIKIMDGSVTN